MSFGDNDWFDNSYYDLFLLPPSSPPLPTEPPPSDLPWTPSITEQHSPDAVLGPAELHGEGLDALQVYADLELAYMEPMDLENTEQITLNMLDQTDADVHTSIAPDTGGSDTFVSSSQTFPTRIPTTQNYSRDGLSPLNHQQSLDGGVVDASLERSQHVSEASILDRITDTENKIEDLLNWKALQTRRGTELKDMMEDILAMLRHHESKLNSEDSRIYTAAN